MNNGKSLSCENNNFYTRYFSFIYLKHIELAIEAAIELNPTN